MMLFLLLLASVPGAALARHRLEPPSGTLIHAAGQETGSFESLPLWVAMGLPSRCFISASTR
jgi:hypothetical protein